MGTLSIAKTSPADALKGDRLPHRPSVNLLTNTQLGNQSTVTVDVLGGQIVQHLAALTNHHQQTTAGVVVVLVYTQVIGQLVDAGGQDGDLDLRGTGVGCVGAVCLDHGSLFVFTNHGKNPPFNDMPLTE